MNLVILFLADAKATEMWDKLALTEEAEAIIRSVYGVLTWLLLKSFWFHLNRGIFFFDSLNFQFLSMKISVELVNSSDKQVFYSNLEINFRIVTDNFANLKKAKQNVVFDFHFHH